MVWLRNSTPHKRGSLNFATTAVQRMVRYFPMTMRFWNLELCCRMCASLQLLYVSLRCSTTTCKMSQRLGNISKTIYPTWGIHDGKGLLGQLSLEERPGVFTFRLAETWRVLRILTRKASWAFDFLTSVRTSRVVDEWRTVGHGDVRIHTSKGAYETLTPRAIEQDGKGGEDLSGVTSVLRRWVW